MKICSCPIKKFLCSFFAIMKQLKNCPSVKCQISLKLKFHVQSCAVLAGVLEDLEREDGDWSCCRKVPHSAVDQGGSLYNGPQRRPAW